MYNELLKIHEWPEDGNISLLLHVDQEPMLALGERINDRFEEAYMIGDNWGAIIHHYLGLHDPGLLDDIEPDPEAGMYAAYMDYTAENRTKMARIADHIRTLLRDEEALMAFIDTHREEIEWE